MLLFLRRLRSNLIRIGFGLVAVVSFVVVAMSVSFAFKAAKTPRGETAAESVEIQPDKAMPPTIKDLHFHSSAKSIASTKEQLDVLLDADESLTPLLAKTGSFEIFLSPTTAADLELTTSDAANWRTLAAESARSGSGGGGGGAGVGGLWLGPDGGGSGGGGGEGGRPANSSAALSGMNGSGGDNGAGGETAGGSGVTTGSGGSGAGPLSTGSGTGGSGPLGTGTSGLVVPGSSTAGALLSGGGLLSAVSSETPTSTAPEPATLLLTAVGLAGLTASRLRNRVSR